MDWKKTLGAVAPLLARAIGGPVGAVAVNVISAALGIDPSEDAIEKKVQSLTAADLISLRNAENQFQKDMKALEIDADKLEFGDRANARQREIDAHDPWTPRALAFLTVGAFIFVVYYVLAGKVSSLKDPMVMGLVGTLIGYVSAKADQVVGYYFGSSAGSRAKDATINQMGKK